MVLGDPVYSVTLLPGEHVRLFTSDRHTRWSYDSESKLAYRHQTTSVESFFTAGMAQAMTNLTVNQSGVSASSYSESWAEGGGGASLDLGIVQIGGGGGGGSYDSSSVATFSRNLAQHAESASRYVSSSVRAKSAVSIGEVEQRNHTQGESEDHYESSSRTFQNPNQCRAITYLFYQINKLQVIRFHLIAIEAHIEDPAAPTAVDQRVPIDIDGQVSVLPQAIPATSKSRIQIEQMARTSAQERRQSAGAAANLPLNSVLRISTADFTSARTPIESASRESTLAAVNAELAGKGLIDPKTRKPTEAIVKELSWERQEILAMPGVIVKGCLDNCTTCEPALLKDIELNLERKALENELLKRKIEILEQSQEYRCCPVGSSEVEEA
jgi:hypothetical protein